MMPIVHALLDFVVGLVQQRFVLQFEMGAGRHQLALSRCSTPRLRIRPSDPMLGARWAHPWSPWREGLLFV